MTETKREDQLKVMGLFEHIDELRGRIIKSMLAIVVLFVLGYAYAKEILIFLEGPLISVLPEHAQALHFTGPMDVFTANIKLGLFVGLMLSCPVWLYQFWKFIEPALYTNEKRYAMPFMVASVTLFAIGVSFCFYVIVPTSLKYLIGLGTEMGTTPIITISDYLSLLMLMMLGFGLVFETPVILVLLALLGLVTAQTLSENRKYVIVVIFIISAVLTPTPDPITMFAMALPTCGMYEMSILFIRFIQRKKNTSGASHVD